MRCSECDLQTRSFKHAVLFQSNVTQSYAGCVTRYVAVAASFLDMQQQKTPRLTTQRELGLTRVKDLIRVFRGAVNWRFASNTNLSNSDRTFLWKTRAFVPK